MSAPAPDPGVNCPRCGYDLRGAMAMWREACPLRGTCVECGLDFEWAELLSPAFDMPRWCVEGPHEFPSLPRRVAGTLAQSLAPWRFWSRLRMSHVGRWGRVAGYLARIAVALYLAFALAHGASTWSHWHGTAAAPGIVVTADGWIVFGQAVTQPLANTEVGIFVSAWGSGRYATPWEIFCHLWPVTLLLPAATALIMHLGCTVAYGALPTTRRQCKVRWSHIVRVALYGLVLAVPAVILTLLAVPLVHAGTPGSALVWGTAMGAWFALPVFEFAWWTAASARYLRVPHAWGVGWAVATIGLLLSMAITSPAWLSVTGP